MKTQVLLEKTLAGIREESKKLFPPEKNAILERHFAELRDQGALEKVAKVGAKAPSFTLTDQNGSRVSSAALLKKGPLVVSFTRGVWCPYCTADIRAQNEVYPAIRDAGAELVAISPQGLSNTRKMARDTELSFSLLSDQDNAIGKAFGVVYAFPDYLKAAYRSFNLDIASINESAAWELPMPARFVIRADGIIADAKVDPDYRYRPEPSEVPGIIKRIRN